MYRYIVHSNILADTTFYTETAALSYARDIRDAGYEAYVQTVYVG